MEAPGHVPSVPSPKSGTARKVDSLLFPCDWKVDGRETTRRKVQHVQAPALVQTHGRVGRSPSILSRPFNLASLRRRQYSVLEGQLD